MIIGKEREKRVWWGVKMVGTRVHSNDFKGLRDCVYLCVLGDLGFLNDFKGLGELISWDICGTMK
jgi:hypothetical protein